MYQVNNCEMVLLIEEEIKNAVVKRYGSIPENVAPECF